MRKVIHLIVGLTLAVVSPALCQVLNKAEYFLDSDPGTGNGTAISITSGASINTNFTVNTTSLSVNTFHTLNIRVRDSNGKWSHFQTKTFFIMPVPVAVSTTISRGEYFFDSDPGIANGTFVPLTPSATVSQNIVVPIGSLSAGFHTFNFRAIDNRGRWSHFSTRSFYVFALPAPAPSTLKKAEYFFDTDPGTGAATPLPIAAANPQNNNFILDVSALSTGWHTLGVRYQDNLGRWSQFSPRTFFVIPASLLPSTKLNRLEYYVDTDPGVSQGTALSIPAASSVDQLFAIDVSGFSAGTHTLFVRTRDDKGYWSRDLSADFTILGCIPPPPPASAGGSICGSGPVTLTASGAAGAQVYRWYADASTFTVLFTGPSYTTPVLNATTVYYVSVFDPGTLCESTRTAVTAGVVSATPPIMNITGNVTICEGNSITLTAPGGFSNYLWSNGATTQQILVNASGAYSVVVGNGTCQSQSSATANIAVATRPAKPSISSSAGEVCSGQTVTVQGPAGSPVYIWSNGASTQQITVNQPGAYSLTIADATGCSSFPSDPVIIQGSPPKPTIVVVGGTTVCEGQSVTLVGPGGMSSYLWSSGTASQQVTVTSGGNYTLQVTDPAGCTSLVSDPTAITVNPAPAKPVITPTGNASICLGQNITLNAPAGFSYIWSNGATTPQIVVNQSGTFTVVVQDTKGCLSASADAVVITAAPCASSHPPAIQDKIIITPVDGTATANLVDLLSDPDNDLDLSSLSIVRPLASGAGAVIDSDQNLTVDYTKTLFAGDEPLTIEVCDFAKNCTRKDLVIRVVGEIVVYNAVSPNGDGLNEMLFLEYIDLLEEAKSNRVRIFNRWGDVVYEASNYNNTTIAFKGLGTNGDLLPNGTYFYRIDFDSGIPYKTGYISLRK